MERIEAANWTDDDRALWARIAAHDFEPAGAALTFGGRLARDHGWSLAAFALSARLQMGGKRPSSGRSRLTPAKLALLAGGTERAADVLVREDSAAGRIAADSRTRRFGPPFDAIRHSDHR